MLVFLYMALGIGVLSFLAFIVGPGNLSDPELQNILLEVRAWRLAAAFTAGAALACAGALIQGILHNPLASPSLLGTSSGANLGGLIVIWFWEQIITGNHLWDISPTFLLPLGCISGAFMALILLLIIIGPKPSMVRVLLSGFILSSLFTSLGVLVTSLAQDSWESGRAMLSFTAGGIDLASPRHVLLAAPLVVVGICAAWSWGRHLDVLLSGEEEAQSLGLDLKSIRYWGMIWTSTLVAAAVAIGGNLAFVGLIVPHVLRPFTGSQHRRLIPPAVLLGGLFVVTADILVRLAPTQSRMPLGVVTSLIGAPLFLYLLAKASKRGQLT